LLTACNTLPIEVADELEQGQLSAEELQKIVESTPDELKVRHYMVLIKGQAEPLIYEQRPDFTPQANVVLW
jgi:CO dehydrogenase/acetyl-CoA synthase gamma subunit (corrinoid Fe-S protein)